MVAAPKLPSPGDCGWKRKETGGWEVIWTTLPEAAKACRELLHCGKDAEDIVNVSRQHSSALHYATVVDIALRTKLQIIAYNYFGVGII